MPDLRTELRAFALGLPETTEDFPWGDRVAKVRGKIFVFLGDAPADAGTITIKLDEAHDHALSIDGARPTDYGLGRAGWVTVPVAGLPFEVLRDWIEESYRLVAPRRLVAALDAGRDLREGAGQ